MKVIVSNGSRISLWRDVKVQGEPMMESFPRIFALSTNKDERLSEYGNRVDEDWIWNSPLRRPCSVGNGSVESFLSLESVDHLFLHCIWSMKLWLNCMSLWGVGVCFSVSLREWWRGWGGLFTKKVSMRAWTSMFFAIVWTIWESRNNKVFRSVEAVFENAMDLVKFRVAWWFKNLGKCSNESVSLLVIDTAERCLDLGKIMVPKMGDWIPPQPEISMFNAVSWINTPCLENINFNRLIYDIHNSIFSFGQMWVEFNPRESNLMADFLAKKGDGDVINRFL
ncbi:hypothetical protein Ddye_011274 [Dipteronia dyeriana]|uniref:RNase H type-1 domain-containing protein n=1 Tax=Dipteronia dyeriana TaxID=168575 RepID=A0AAE0CHX1_9ROSI|nr:hypothetical protein Ddye_011274 [Dipteronia dyeriana]